MQLPYRVDSSHCHRAPIVPDSQGQVKPGLGEEGPASTELNKVAQGGDRKVLLNVERLEYVSSAGLRAIMVAAKLLEANGGAAKICRANDAVKHVTEVSGFNSLLHLYDTEDKALAAFA